MLSAHVHNQAQYVGKGRLLYRRMLAAAAFISGCIYIDADVDATCNVVCALQSSSFNDVFVI